MENCGHCETTKVMFEKELESGEIEMRSSEDAGGRFRGFPSFLNTDNDMVHTGRPNDKQDLYKILGVMESYNDDIPLYYVSPPPLVGNIPYLPLGDFPPTALFYSDSEKSQVIFFTGRANPLVIEVTPNVTDHMVVKNTMIDLKVAFSKTMLDITQNLQPLEIKFPDMMTRMFPCTTISDWSNVNSVLKLFDKVKAKTIKGMVEAYTTNPCKNDKNLHCCKGTDGPVLFDTKTIVMSCLIVLLVFVILYFLVKN
jgi:hypothetical protein